MGMTGRLKLIERFRRFVLGRGMKRRACELSDGEILKALVEAAERRWEAERRGELEKRLMESPKESAKGVTESAPVSGPGPGGNEHESNQFIINSGVDNGIVPVAGDVFGARARMVVDSRGYGVWVVPYQQMVISGAVEINQLLVVRRASDIPHAIVGVLRRNRVDMGGGLRIVWNHREDVGCVQFGDGRECVVTLGGAKGWMN